MNQGAVDRGVRLNLGLVAMVLGGSGVLGTPAGVVLVVLGGALLVTGLWGYCPLYRWMGWSTVPKAG